MDPFLVLSIGFMAALAVIVIGFIVKLKLDERSAQSRTRELLAAAGGRAAPRPAQPRGMPPSFGTGSRASRRLEGCVEVVAGGRRQGGARRRGLRRGADDSDFENEEPLQGGATFLPPSSRWLSGIFEGGALDDSEEEAGELDASDFGLEGKVGKKKLAKLQAKEEKRAQRAADIQVPQTSVSRERRQGRTGLTGARGAEGAREGGGREAGGERGGGSGGGAGGGGEEESGGGREGAEGAGGVRGDEGRVRGGGGGLRRGRLPRERQPPPGLHRLHSPDEGSASLLWLQERNRWMESG